MTLSTPFLFIIICSGRAFFNHKHISAIPYNNALHLATVTMNKSR